MARYEPLDWYENALYYDIVFDTETKHEADFLQAVFARYVRSRGRQVLEPACGTGRLVAALARRRFRVTGFDVSPGSLRFARDRLRRRGLDARLLRARMENFSLSRRFDLAHCLISSFKYLLTENAARAHLRCVADALKPGGVYALGLHLTDYNHRACGHERWVGRRRGVEVVCNIRGWPADRRKRLERVRSRLLVREKGRERRFETEWLFRTYGFRQLKSLLRTVPRLEHVATYDYNHDIDNPIPFNGQSEDNVLILRRR